MRILYFHQHFSTPKGSTGTRSYELARRLIARGHSVTMVCGSFRMGVTGLSGEPKKGIRRGEVDGIDVIELQLPYSNYDGLVKRAWTFLRFAFRCCRVAWREPHDLLFATTTPLTAGIPGIARKRLFRKQPFVFEVRDLWPELPKAMGVVTNPLILTGMSWLEKASYRAADGCVGLAPGIVEGIKRRGRKTTPVAMIPNGCDLEHFSAAASARRLEEGPLNLVFAGAHGVANGLHHVLAAARVVEDRLEGAVAFHFIGDGKRKPALQEQAAELKLSHVHFHDPRPKDELVAFLGTMHVGIMALDNIEAFYFGTSPNKFFDYLAAGLPVINNYPGWVAGMVDEQQCGWVVPPENPEAFADAVAEAVADFAEVRRRGERARSLAEASFDRAKLAEEWVDFIESVEAENR